jgi:Tfp pilus assembly protein FimT
MTKHWYRANVQSTGYTVAELALTCGLIGLLAAISVPFFLSFYAAARLRVAADEVAAFVNHGRQLGIRENTGVCVHIGPTALQYRLGSSCGGPAWLGPGTDAAGNIAVPHGITLTTTAHPIFTYLGAAVPAATITVKPSAGDAALRVSVAASGRVSVGP